MVPNVITLLSIGLPPHSSTFLVVVADHLEIHAPQEEDLDVCENGIAVHQDPAATTMLPEEGNTEEATHEVEAHENQHNNKNRGHLMLLVGVGKNGTALLFSYSVEVRPGTAKLLLYKVSQILV